MGLISPFLGFEIRWDLDLGFDLAIQKLASPLKFAFLEADDLLLL